MLKYSNLFKGKPPFETTMPKPGYVVLTISAELDNKLERLKKKMGARSKQEVIKALAEGALN